MYVGQVQMSKGELSLPDFEII